jgi:hypothetical protein
MWFQILVQHIRTVLPGLKSRISAQLTAVSKELSLYGDPIDSKVCFEFEVDKVMTHKSRKLNLHPTCFVQYLFNMVWFICILVYSFCLPCGDTSIFP